MGRCERGRERERERRKGRERKRNGIVFNRSYGEICI